MPGAHEEHSIIGPPPCATCRCVKRCAVTGEACLAFHQYVYGKRWDTMPKQPRADLGKRLGFTAKPLPEVRVVMPWEVTEAVLNG